MDDREKKSGASFNMSLATLQRIDAILREIIVCRANSKTDYNKLRSLLEILNQELFPFLSEKEKGHSFDILIDIKGCYVNVGNEIKVKRSIYDLLDEFERFQRRMLYEKGLLMAQSDDPSYALGGG